MEPDYEINSLYDESNYGSNKQKHIEHANYLRNILNGISNHDQIVIGQITILENSKKECKKIGATKINMIKLIYTDPLDSSKFFLYVPDKWKQYLVQQTGGADSPELETTGKFKPYGLKIKIGETGDFPSSKLKSKILGSADIHAYFIKDVDFVKIKKNMPEGKSNFTSESGLRDFLQKGRYFNNKRNLLNFQIKELDQNKINMGLEQKELNQKIINVKNEIKNIEKNDRYKELKELIQNKNDEIEKTTDENSRNILNLQKQQHLNELNNFNYEGKKDMLNVYQGKLEVIENQLAANVSNRSELEKNLIRETEFVKAKQDKNFNTNIGYILETFIKAGTHITNEGKDYTIGSVSWDGSSQLAKDVTGTSMPVYEVRVDVIILEGKINMDTMKGQLKSSCKLRRKKIIHSVKRMLGKVKGSIDSFSNFAYKNYFDNSRGTRKNLKIKIN